MADSSCWSGRGRLDVDDRDEAPSSSVKRLAEEDLVQVAPTECLRLVSLALMREARSEAMTGAWAPRVVRGSECELDGGYSGARHHCGAVVDGRYLVLLLLEKTEEGQNTNG